MSQYYYTVAALPYLNYDSEYKGEDDFLSFCEKTISEKDFSLLKEAKLNSDSLVAASENNILKRWQAWERGFRLELAKLRGEKSKKAPDAGFPLPEDPESLYKIMADYLDLPVIARNVFAALTPLSGEEFILKSYWEKLEELETGHYFDIEKILIYYLKLQVLRRKSSFDEEAGTKRYNDIYTNILKASVTAVTETTAV